MKWRCKKIFYLTTFNFNPDKYYINRKFQVNLAKQNPVMCQTMKTSTNNNDESLANP